MAATPVANAAVASDRGTIGRFGEVLRDIARGGIAGGLTGFVVAGVGGRLMMRLAAIAVPSSAGRFTENGNQIDVITVPGSLGLVLAGGLFFGLFGGTLWVVVSPWIPGAGLRRALVTVPIAMALTGIALVQGDNPDFRTLHHDGRVVAMLLVIIALAGVLIALLDGWLDHRLPLAGTSGRMDTLYAAVALAGGLLILPIVIQLSFEASAWRGVGMVGVGLATLTWWALRYQGQPMPPARLMIAGRLALLAVTVIGALELASELAVALGTT